MQSHASRRPDRRVAAAFLAWAVRGRSSSVFGRSYWRGPRRPARHCADVRRRTQRKHARRFSTSWRGTASRATFFQCGANVDASARRSRAQCPRRRARDRQPQLHASAPLLPIAGFHRGGAAPRAGDHRAAHRRRAGLVPRALRRPLVRAAARAQRRLGLTGVMWTVIGYDWNRKADAVVERLAAARLERRHPLPSRWTGASREAGYRRHRGGRPAPGSHAAGPGIQIRNGKPTPMSDDLIQRVLKVIATSKRIPLETVTIDSEFAAAGNRFHGRRRDPVRARERVRHQHSR